MNVRYPYAVLNRYADPAPGSHTGYVVSRHRTARAAWAVYHRIQRACRLANGRHTWRDIVVVELDVDRPVGEFAHGDVVHEADNRGA